MFLPGIIPFVSRVPQDFSELSLHALKNAVCISVTNDIPLFNLITKSHPKFDMLTFHLHLLPTEKIESN